MRIKKTPSFQMNNEKVSLNEKKDGKECVDLFEKEGRMRRPLV
jgi:hypothetical protein